MKYDNGYQDILKMIDREERILEALNIVRQSMENEDDDYTLCCKLRRLVSIYEESQDY